MMAGESKSEVQEVVISEDENSRDGSGAIVRTKPAKQKLPPVNVPEKIVLCLDVSPSCSKMAMGAIDREVEPLVVLKQAVLIFILNKLGFNPQTEISMILLNGSSVFLYFEFTNEKKKIIERIKKINVTESEDMEADHEMPYSLDELFQIIADSVELPVKVENANFVPPFIVRCVFFYSRARILSFTMSDVSFQQLFSSRYFVFDSLFLHDADMDVTLQKEIVTALAELDVTGYSYVLESDNNTVRFMNQFSLLAAHPLQRPHQSEFRNEVMYFKKLLS